LYELKLTWDAIEDVFSMHFARYGLSSAKFNALVHLYMAGDRGLTQAELGKKVLVSRPTMSGLIERLEKDNLVVRNADPADKRVFRVCLTKRSFELMHTFLPIHNDCMHKVMSTLDKREKETLIALLGKIRKGLG
jgi:MarR family 2-MHQ and catechol resistance regulon transcriptional repressor